MPCQVNLFAPVDKKRTFQANVGYMTPSGTKAG
jgi:hypothetical protein